MYMCKTVMFIVLNTNNVYLFILSSIHYFFRHDGIIVHVKKQTHNQHLKSLIFCIACKTIAPMVDNVLYFLFQQVLSHR